jgi:hypothetical protein
VKTGTSLSRLLLGALVLATVFYAGGFALNEHLRQRRGPWEVTFGATPTGAATLLIRQPRLGIGPVEILFDGCPFTNPTATVRFDTPHLPLPFGRVKHDDLSYLPGVVTLEAFGHEVELMPRALLLNRRAQDWNTGSTRVLSTNDRPESLPEPRPTRRPRSP